jgi:DNA-binding NarL/FixJ family response regulator
MKEATRSQAAKGKTMTKTKVLLVDDHPIVREGLARLIVQEDDLEVCGEAADENTAWSLVTAHEPGMVLVDLSLKTGNGLELIKRIRGAYAEMPILVISMHDEIFYVERALRAGASGYLTKEEAGDNVLVAIRKLLNGDIYLSERLSPTIIRRLLSGSGGSEDSPISRLSDRELEVFQMIGQGLAAQEIADRLHLSFKTIETYQAHIKEKLGLRDIRKLVQYAVRWEMEAKERR